MHASIRLGTVFFVSVLASAVRSEDPPAAGPAAGSAVPTLSIEAVSVNDIPIPNAPVKQVNVSLGDVITCKIYARDWSPSGEIMRAYQFKLDADSFATGDDGVVQPVDFQMHPDNDPNAQIDQSDPEWAHKGRSTIPLVDTVSPGYRWLSVLLDAESGPVSQQDGKKYVCGTLKLKPSANANGTFSIALVEVPSISGFLNPENQPIFPVEYERLMVEITADARWRKLLSSDPPDGSVDARRAPGSSWDKMFLSFNCESSPLPAADLTVEDGTPNPPRVKNLVGKGTTVIVELDRPIRTGAWTKIIHKPSQTGTRIGNFPGDVNGDGKADAKDAVLLIRAIDGLETLPTFRTDIDRDGSLGAGDLLALLELVTPSPGTPKTAAKQ